MGSNNYIAYNGTGNSVTVTGLTPGKTYYFRVIEYNKNSETGNNALYLLGSNPVANIKTGLSYSFTGNGNWNNSANWRNGLIPPAVLPAGSNILIDPSTGGECVMNVNLTVSPGASLTVQTGKKLRIPGNLTIQ